jgi:hypothetical protein
MRTSHAPRAVPVRLRTVGLDGEAALIEAEAGRVHAIENAI